MGWYGLRGGVVRMVSGFWVGNCGVWVSRGKPARVGSRGIRQLSNQAIN